MKLRQILILIFILLLGIGLIYGATAKTTTNTKKYTNKNVIKQKAKKLNITAKPSCGCKYKYKWYKRTYLNWCPNCKHINCLVKNPKRVPERELTCKYCDSDFCGNCGKEKMYHSSKYLLRV